VGKFWGITKGIALHLEDGFRLEAFTARKVIFRRLRNVDLKHKSHVEGTVTVSVSIS
jgi:hypothetical protein